MRIVNRHEHNLLSKTDLTNPSVNVRIRECGPRSQPLVWEPEALERSNGLVVYFVCICVSLYPILDAGRVRFSESPVRFTRKWIKKGCVKGKAIDKPILYMFICETNDSVEFENYVTN